MTETNRAATMQGEFVPVQTDAFFPVGEHMGAIRALVD
jgi:hypothetical protein